MESFTVFSKRQNKSIDFTSNLRDSEVVEILGTLARDNNFAASLYHTALQRGWSVAQRAWAHKLAVDTVSPPAPAPVDPALVPTANLSRVIEMFDAAAKARKSPRITFAQTDTRIGFSLKQSSQTSKYPGQVYVAATKRDGFGELTYFGRIDRDGVFQPSRKSTPEVAAALEALAADPIGYASASGHETGRCCFCSRLLTDATSVANGYGPICAQTFALVIATRQLEPVA